MVKATNPHTRQSEIVTNEQAEAMKRGIACREYHFEVLQPIEAAEPPAVEPPEHLPTPPPAVNMPEDKTKGLDVLLAHPDEVEEGLYDTPFGKIQVTKAPKGRK